MLAALVLMLAFSVNSFAAVRQNRVNGHNSKPVVQAKVVHKPAPAPVVYAPRVVAPAPQVVVVERTRPAVASDAAVVVASILGIGALIAAIAN